MTMEKKMETTGSGTRWRWKGKVCNFKKGLGFRVLPACMSDLL